MRYRIRLATPTIIKIEIYLDSLSFRNNSPISFESGFLKVEIVAFRILSPCRPRPCTHPAANNHFHPTGVKCSSLSSSLSLQCAWIVYMFSNHTPLHPSILLPHHYPHTDHVSSGEGTVQVASHALIAVLPAQAPHRQVHHATRFWWSPSV